MIFKIDSKGTRFNGRCSFWAFKTFSGSVVRVDFIGFVLYDLYNTNVIGQKVFETLNTKSRKAFMALVQGLRSINAKFGFDPITATLTFSL